ncbi:hypothetical protein E4T38_05324 [Aureobasidium subglaciale]|nr:hypothetical protein E4T38_05324 [Aureobasidium subglaciale]KAI5221756.1 hypothetical protein E4T40_05257 [Aureobasidium subglaciale]KAI5225777.1 hypothetical protein E4T41_05076 [Aureobasidium subglaciale]KAI5261624.1 hypothetical protein E4T46_04969 [Aureobasidium subglaciale]
MADLDDEHRCSVAAIEEYTWQHQFKDWVAEAAAVDNPNEHVQELAAALIEVKERLGTRFSPDERNRLQMQHSTLEHDPTRLSAMSCSPPSILRFMRLLMTTTRQTRSSSMGAGMASFGDIATAYIPNWHTVQHIVLAGDSAQQYAMLEAKGRNEFSWLEAESFLFEFEEGERKLTSVMLIEPYRMCLSISKPISDILSKGLLQTHHSALRSYTEAKQLMSFFKTGLGGGYHNWELFGVDISGQTTEIGALVQSQQSRQTTSSIITSSLPITSIFYIDSIQLLLLMSILMHKQPTSKRIP